MASTTRTIARATARVATRNTFSTSNTGRQSVRYQSRRAFSSGAASSQQQQQQHHQVPPPPPPKGGSSSLLYIAGAAALGGAGYWYFRASGAAAAAPKAFKPTKEDYQRVYDEIADRLEEEEDYDDGSYGPVVLRLAWHASGTYDKETGTGGSNGATMRFAPESDHGANSGLLAARKFLEPTKANHPWISYSDLWILAGVCAIQEMQGPIIPFRPGRADRDVAACTPDGRLPDGSKGSDHLRNIFGRMGFSDQEIVALSGAHALGRCHTDRSGFEGPWTHSPTMLTNDFYRLLVEEKWQYKKWNGNKQFEDVKTKGLMMLPTDMVLITDPKFKPFTEKYAKDADAFFSDFSAAVLRLFELGVPFTPGTENQRWNMKATWQD